MKIDFYSKAVRAMLQACPESAPDCAARTLAVDEYLLSLGEECDELHTDLIANGRRIERAAGELKVSLINGDNQLVLQILARATDDAVTCRARLEYARNHLVRMVRATSRNNAAKFVVDHVRALQEAAQGS
jgi:hypothetical protein